LIKLSKISIAPLIYSIAPFNNLMEVEFEDELSELILDPFDGDQIE